MGRFMTIKRDIMKNAIFVILFCCDLACSFVCWSGVKNEFLSTRSRFAYDIISEETINPALIVASA